MYTHTLESTPLGVRAALDGLRAVLPLEPDNADMVEIALAEALNNVVEHAYGFETGHKVELSAELAPPGLSIDIRDSGKPLEGLSLPVAEAAMVDVPVDELPEGGYGWYLIHTLTSGVKYQRIEGQNRLTLQFDL